MHRTHAIPAALAALVLATAVPAAAQRADTFRWSGALEAGRTLTIEGINGGIEASPASGGEIEVVATKESEDGDVGEVRIDVHPTEDGVTICAVYPGMDGCGPVERRGRNRHGDDHDNDTVIEWVVRVPRGVHLDASTVNGKVEIRGLSGDVHASTVNGGIEVAAAGAVEATTVNGSITASTGAARWDGTLDFRTVNGSITLDLPAGTAADVEAKTLNGGLRTDFPLTIEAGREWGPRTMRGTIAGGGGRLRLETVNGGITLRRS